FPVSVPTKPEDSSRGLEQLSPAAQDLLSQLLERQPGLRPPVAAVIHHPWLAAAAAEELSEATSFARASFSWASPPFCLQGVREAARLRRLALLAVAKELEDQDALSFSRVFRVLEAECGGPLTLQALENRRPLQNAGRHE
ncbi:unnamed protein product, partial [Polarella glacialis]